MADCNTCKEKRRDFEPVPYVAHEKSMARADRRERRHIAVHIISLVLIAACVAFCFILNKNCLDKIEIINRECLEKIDKINKDWLDYIAQYDFEDYTETYQYSQNGKGVNIIGDNNGVDYNGTKTESNDENEETQTQGWKSER